MLEALSLPTVLPTDLSMIFQCFGLLDLLRIIRNSEQFSIIVVRVFLVWKFSVTGLWRLEGYRSVSSASDLCIKTEEIPWNSPGSHVICRSEIFTWSATTSDFDEIFETEDWAHIINNFIAYQHISPPRDLNWVSEQLGSAPHLYRTSCYFYIPLPWSTDIRGRALRIDISLLIRTFRKSTSTVTLTP